LLRSSLQSAIQCLENFPATPIHRTFLIGGASVYAEGLALPRTETGAAYVDRILLTRILSPAFDECDVFMPDFAAEDDKWKRADQVELAEWAGFDVPAGVQEENGVEYEFQMWVR
jgi:dihydrofolate reductase